MAREIVITPDARYVRWIKNFDKLGSKPLTQEAKDEWLEATEVLFDLTQQYAHVLSGDMVGSGEYGLQESSRTSITSHVTYGGGRRSDAKPHWKHQMIDYTEYELARGGSHDFFARASVSAHKRLQQGALAALEAQLNSEEW